MRPVTVVGTAPLADGLDTNWRALTAVEFDVLWEGLGLGPTPVVLRLESPGRTHTERREVQAASWQALRARGLAGLAGPDAELTRLLHVLARPVEQLELRGCWSHSVRAVAAGRAGAGVLAVRQDETVTLGSCGSLPSGLLDALPPAEPGPGRASTVPTAALVAAVAAAGAANTGLRTALIVRDVPATEAGLLARMLDGTERRAQIVAVTGDQRGITRRSGGVLEILDGPRGRYLTTRTVSEDGAEWTNVAPTDDRRLRQRLADLLTPTPHPGPASRHELAPESVPGGPRVGSARLGGRDTDQSRSP